MVVVDDFWGCSDEVNQDYIPQPNEYVPLEENLDTIEEEEKPKENDEMVKRISLPFFLCHCKFTLQDQAMQKWLQRDKSLVRVIDLSSNYSDFFNCFNLG